MHCTPIQNRLFHLISYYIFWFVGVYSAAQMRAGTGIIITLIIFALQIFWQYRIAQDTRHLISLIILLTLCGTLVDSIMVWLHIFIYQDNAFYPYLCPPWMIMQWLELGFMVHALFQPMWKRPVFTGLCCLVGFPLAYLSGARMGAVTFVYSDWSVILIGVIWMILLPAIMMYHSRNSHIGVIPTNISDARAYQE